MKRATGKTDTPQPGYKVSIQQSLDGHSFSVAAPPAFPAEAERIEAEVLTPRTMLVPVEYFAGERAAALLAANGMPALSGEETVCSNSKFSAIFCSHGTRGARPGPGLFLAKIVQERRNAKFYSANRPHGEERPERSEPIADYSENFPIFAIR